MASSGSLARWNSDITDLYNILRNVQATHGLSQTSVPSNPGYINASDISTLKNLADAAYSAEGHLNGCSYSSPSVPSRGTLIYPSGISGVTNALNTLNSICHFNASFCSFSFNDCDFCNFGFSLSGCTAFNNT